MGMQADGELSEWSTEGTQQPTKNTATFQNDITIHGVGVEPPFHIHSYMRQVRAEFEWRHLLHQPCGIDFYLSQLPLCGTTWPPALLETNSNPILTLGRTHKCQLSANDLNNHYCWRSCAHDKFQGKSPTSGRPSYGFAVIGFFTQHEVLSHMSLNKLRTCCLVAADLAALHERHSLNILNCIPPRRVHRNALAHHISP